MIDPPLKVDFQKIKKIKNSKRKKKNIAANKPPPHTP
jgi:hypothetical protein